MNEDQKAIEQAQKKYKTIDFIGSIYIAWSLFGGVKNLSPDWSAQKTK